MYLLSKIKNAKKENTVREKKIYYLPTGSIIPNPNRTRHTVGNVSLSKLSDSIQKYGILQPILIRKRDIIPFVEAGGERIYSEKYEIVAGERRWLAAMMLNLDEVPCIITDADAKLSLEMSLTENIQRENLHFLEEAEGASKLIRGFGADAYEAAETVSLTKSSLANRFRLLRLEDEEKNAIIRSGLSERHMTAISKVDCKEKRLSLLEQASSASMSAPETERAVEELLHPAYKTKGDEKRKVSVISDIGFFLNSLNRAINVLESAGIKVYKSEIDHENELEVNLKIKKKTKKK